jgi:pilus assembly protein Flp/PilA
MLITYLKARLATLRKDEEGATMIEYGLLAALIAVALIGVIVIVQNALSGTFNEVADGLESKGQ